MVHKSPILPAFPQVSRSKVRKALRELIKSTHDVDHYLGLIDAWRDENTNHDNDRSHSLIIVAWIERILEFAIQTKLTGEFDRPPWHDRLFGGDERGAIDGFAGKIIIGYAMGLYSEQVREDLQQIRHIRNVFAHSMVDIDFNTPEIADACHFYTVSRIWGKRVSSRQWLSNASARHRFITAIFVILLDLWGVLGREDQTKARPRVWRVHKLPIARTPSLDKPKSRDRRTRQSESQKPPTPRRPP